MNGASRERFAPEVLVILDGASEPVGAGQTSLERAVTPALDALCAAGTLTRVRTVAPWLEAGSEHAIPALLGWVPPAAVDRGAVEAAARAIDVPAGCRAWRVDVREARGGGRADAGAVRAAVGEGLQRSTGAAAARPVLHGGGALPRFTVHALGGHRLLIVGPAPLPSLPSFAGVTLHVWPEGVVPPRLFGAGVAEVAADADAAPAETVVVAALGAASGIARLMGARVMAPPGATGRPGSDLTAKARAAVGALAAGAGRVVVHVGAPDEAAHELDAAAKVAAIEAADRELIAPLAEAAHAAGGSLRVCPDHGCDPADGRHDAAPVPCLTWSAAQAAPGNVTGAPGFAQGAPLNVTGAPSSAQGAPRRLTERAVAGLPVVELAQRERVAA